MEKDQMFYMKDHDIPNWLRTYISTKKTPQETLDYLFERLKKAPTEKGLLLAASLVYELSRKKDEPGTSGAFLTQENVSRYIKLSQP
jgi:hypothetical protein